VCAVVVTLVCATAVGAQGQEVKEQEMPSIGRQFHDQTSSDENGFKGPDIRYGDSVPAIKLYPGGKPFKLPRTTPDGLSVEKAIRGRRSIRDYSQKPVSIAHTSLLIRAAYGCTHTSAGFTHRSVPSAGGLFPMEVYLVARRVDSLPQGLYHFQVKDTSLVLLREGDLVPAVWEGTFQQDAAADPALVLLFSARFDRVTKKYADRGYRYAYMEAGAMYQNVYLEAASLGLGTVVLGAFQDEVLNKFLEIDGVREAILCVMPVGVPR
jgi:SagB-type dehydrogenase family enzyme